VAFERGTARLTYGAEHGDDVPTDGAEHSDDGTTDARRTGGTYVVYERCTARMTDGAEGGDNGARYVELREANGRYVRRARAMHVADDVRRG
jgi:hypothetical protein